MEKGLLRLGWLAAVCVLVLATLAHGQNLMIYPGACVSCTPTNTWNDAASWWVSGTSPPVNRLPVDGDNASVSILNSFTLDTNTANLGELIIGSGNASFSGTFLQPGSTLTAASEGVTEFIVYNQTGGTNNGGTFSVSATYNLQGAGSSLSATSEGIDQLNFGPLGNSPGIFNQSDGTNTVSGTLGLGAFQFANNGTYNLNGGQLSAGTEVVGIGGTGFFNQNGGTNTISGQLTLGSQAGSGSTGPLSADNTYTLSGGNLSAANLVVGDAGSGTFNQTGGTNTISGHLTLGNQAGGVGEYDLRGTATLEAGTEIFGSGGSTYRQTGGTNTVHGDLTEAQNSSGSYNLSGNNALLKVGGDENLGVEDGSRIDFVQSGGHNQVVGNLNLGGTLFLNISTPTGRGSYELDGGLVSVGGSEVISPRGHFVQTGGTNTANHLVLQGTYELGQAIFPPTQGLAVLAVTDEMIGMPALLSGTTTFTQRGGTNTTGTLTLGDRGNYELIGGTLNASEIINTCSGLCSSLLLNQRGGLFDYVGGDLNGNFNNEVDGTFRILGPGTRVVNGSLTNTGTVEVTADQVEFSNVILPSGVFHVDPSTVQFQNLSVGAAGVITGVAGDIFDITGNFENLSTQNTLWETGAAELEFGGTGTHTFDLAGHDGLGFTNNFAWGTLAIDSGNTLDLGTGSGDALYVDFLQGLSISGNTITNIDGMAGLFLYYNSGDNPSLNGNYNLTGGGELIAARGPAPTPEPSSVILMSTGLAALLACSFLRKRAAAAH